MTMKSRLDLLLVARGLAPTREKAQAMILSGRVEVEGRRVEKAGAPVDAGASVQVLGPPHPYVSRGGVKLAAALDAFGIRPEAAICLDRATHDLDKQVDGRYEKAEAMLNEGLRALAEDE